MVYNPTAPVARILDLALAEVNAVQYGVTAQFRDHMSDLEIEEGDEDAID